MSDTTIVAAPDTPNARPAPDAPPHDTAPTAPTVDLWQIPTKTWKHLHSIVTGFALDSGGWTAVLNRSNVLKKLFRPAGRANCFNANDLNAMLAPLKARGFASESPDGLRFKCPSRIEADALLAEFYRTMQRALGQPGGVRAITSSDAADVHHVALLGLEDAARRAEAARADGDTGKPLGRAPTPIKAAVTFYKPDEKTSPATAALAYSQANARAREDGPAVTTS